MTAPRGPLGRRRVRRPASRGKPRRLPIALWLTIVWLALWRDTSLATAGAGLLVAGVLLSAFPPRREALPAVVRPLAAIRLASYFAWKLLEATAVVAWEVLTPRNRIVEGVVAVPLAGVSDTVTTVVANAISLTPGTLTLEVHRRPTVLYVHILHLQDIERTRRDIQKLERLAIQAFSPDPHALDAAEEGA